MLEFFLLTGLIGLLQDGNPMTCIRGCGILDEH